MVLYIYTVRLSVVRQTVRRGQSAFKFAIFRAGHQGGEEEKNICFSECFHHVARVFCTKVRKNFDIRRF